MYMATQSGSWTLDELHRLPDDGNKYELVRGELFVTPPPSWQHETIAARLARILDPYVKEQKLGLVFRPRAVFRTEDGEVEPDLMVRSEAADVGNAWEVAPLPILIVEIISPTTRRRDSQDKRRFYLDNGVAQYWVVDPDSRMVVVLRPKGRDVQCTTALRWHPTGASHELVISVPDLFVGLTLPA